MRWFDQVPLSMLVMFAILLGLAPMFPEPHLVEKLRMLMNGTLTRPIDIIDLIMHGAPTLLVLLKLYRMSVVSKNQ